MKSSAIAILIVFFAFLFVPSVLGDVNSIEKMRSTSDAKIKKLKNLSKLLKNLSRLPDPTGLTPGQQRAVNEYNQWLKKTAATVNKFAKNWDSKFNSIIKGDPTEQLFSATKSMQEMQMSFNLQYLQLQNKISHENRQFSMVSNIMKTKHDTAKNCINNVR